MEMTKQAPAKSALIIGAGYSGLACAVSLIDNGYRIYLVEKSPMAGGLGCTHKLSNGRECETFYHHFFTHDNYLLASCKRFLGSTPTFVEGTMAIYYRGKHYPWNGLKDLLLYPYISLSGKIRFVVATLLLSHGLLPASMLDGQSLKIGMLRLFGKDAFNSVWRPMLAGKFGSKIDSIPLRWMQGRLRQRLQSRKHGTERLGYQPGSISLLTDAIISFINHTPESEVLCGSTIASIESNQPRTRYRVHVSTHQNQYQRYLDVDQILMTTPTGTANEILSTACKPTIAAGFASQEYFLAYCVLIEMNTSLTSSYWTNIADESLFFCGYIEQTRLTGTDEYGGLHIAYLTKYVSPGEDDYSLTKQQVLERAKRCLTQLFPDHDLSSVIISMSAHIARNAQVITGFDFKPPPMDGFKDEGLFLGNMSHVYPDERSINNAICIGETLARQARDASFMRCTDA